MALRRKYNGHMARGRESQSAESRTEAAGTQVAPFSDERISVEESNLRQKRESLNLSRARVLRELEASQNPRYRNLMEKALADLNAELRRLERGTAHARSTRQVDRTRFGDSSAAATGHADIAEKAPTDAAVLAHAYETFGSPEKANHWLHRPNHVFQGRTPLEVVGTDPQSVEIGLTRIDHGVYI